MMDVCSFLSRFFQSPSYQRLTASSCSFRSWSTLLGVCPRIHLFLLNLLEKLRSGVRII